MIDPRHPEFSNFPGSAARPRFDYASAHGTPRPPLVSVVTPLIGAPYHLADTARSLLAQSLQDFEWILITTAATPDESRTALANLAAADPRVRVIEAPGPTSPAAALNTGFAHAASDYIYQLNTGVLLEPTCLEQCFWFLLRHTDFSYCSTFEVEFGARERLVKDGFHTHAAFLAGGAVNPGAVMVRKSAHRAAEGYHQTIPHGWEVWDLFLRATNHGNWGATLPEHLTWRFTDHGPSPTNNGASRHPDIPESLLHRHAPFVSGAKPLPWITPRWPGAYERVERDLPATHLLAKARPRLLLVVPWMLVGGADKFNLDMIGQLNRLGWETTVACTLRADHAWMPEFSKLTPDIFILPNFLMPVDHPLFLRHLIASRQPDVVMISNSELGFLSLPYLRAVCPAPAYVDYVHMEESYWKNGGYARYSVGSQQQLDLTMVASDHLKRWMTERGAEADRIDVRTINIDPARWKPDPAVRVRVRAALNIPDDLPVILFAGRLVAQKQPRVLAATFGELAARGERFLALVAGDGDERPAVEAIITAHRLNGHVRMLGETSSARIHELMNAADIFFLPSLWEGIALVLYEAMASGVSFVGARVGGQAELLTPECGVLIDRSGDPDDEARRYADELARLLHDPAKRAEMGRAGVARIREHFTLDAMGEAVVASFQRAIRLARESPRLTMPLAFAHECADRAVEFMRINQACDALSSEVQRNRVVAAIPVPSAAAAVSVGTSTPNSHLSRLGSNVRGMIRRIVPLRRPPHQ